MTAARPWPVVLSLPHCGLAVPAAVAADWALDARQVRAEADLGTEEIYAGLPALAVVKASVSRLVVDLNRGPDDGSEGGVIPLKTYPNPERREIYPPGRRPDAAGRNQRLKDHYWPFHHELRAALRVSGVQGLLDCHSMDPSNPDGSPRPQVCLGTCNGQTCGDERLLRLQAAFAAQGFQVACQEPYAGGYITRRYGQELAARGLFAVQIELNKGLYLTPGGLELVPERLADARQRVAAALASFCAGL
ncbi:MAG: N-formylglutamate amidohydrolase [Thermodesulfobacteriota bacterium]